MAGRVVAGAHTVSAAAEREDARGAHLRVRAELMVAARDLIRRRGLRQRDAAALFGVAQPRVSDLVRGKVALFSVDALIDMLAALGMRVEITVRAAGRHRSAGGAAGDGARIRPGRPKAGGA